MDGQIPQENQCAEFGRPTINADVSSGGRTLHTSMVGMKQWEAAPPSLDARVFLKATLLGLFSLALIRTAWMCDDAYITLRTVDNFVSGFGPRWNVAERVQAYTHPLWMFVLALAVLLYAGPVLHTAYHLNAGLGGCDVAPGCQDRGLSTNRDHLCDRPHVFAGIRRIFDIRARKSTDPSVARDFFRVVLASRAWHTA